MLGTRLPKMIKIRRQFVDADYGQMHMRVAGAPSDKRALLCLHQSPKSSREFINFMPLAATDRQVIAIDSPGHGESDIPENPIGIEGYAREIWSAIDALGLKNIDIVGYHTGSLVGAEMAAQRPKSVGGIVMISATVLTPEEDAAFAAQFEPVPLDEAGTRFSNMWAKCIKYRGKGVSLENLAFLMAEYLRAGDDYERGHQAAFQYTAQFITHLRTLPHKITVLNPNDLLFEYTKRAAPLLRNGAVVDHMEWELGFLDTDPHGAVKAVISALD